MVSLVVPVIVSLLMTRIGDLLPRKGGLGSGWDLLQNQFLLHRVHPKLHESIPILFTKIVFVHIANDFLDGILVF